MVLIKIVFFFALGCTFICVLYLYHFIFRMPSFGVLEIAEILLFSLSFQFE